MAFTKVKKHIEDLSANMQTLVNYRLKYLELVILKEVTDSTADIIKGFLLTIVFVVFLGFASVGGALLLGAALDNYSLGFFIIGGFFLLLFFAILIFGKKYFMNFLVKFISKKIMKYKKNKN